MKKRPRSEPAPYSHCVSVTSCADYYSHYINPLFFLCYRSLLTFPQSAHCCLQSNLNFPFPSLTVSFSCTLLITMSQLSLLLSVSPGSPNKIYVRWTAVICLNTQCASWSVLLMTSKPYWVFSKRLQQTNLVNRAREVLNAVKRR